MVEKLSRITKVDDLAKAINETLAEYSATAEDGVNIAITVNGSDHNNGEAATWNTGSNTVTITASKTGCTPTTYTVTVTKSE